MPRLQDEQITIVGNTATIDGARSFTVKKSTAMFLPLTAADDSQPVFSTKLPKNHAGAAAIWYPATGIGASGATVAVDGVASLLSPSYLVGPLRVSKLADGSGHRIIEEAVFLRPMTVGHARSQRLRDLLRRALCAGHWILIR